eukprot:4985826-Amphidinium_carterae.1
MYRSRCRRCLVPRVLSEGAAERKTVGQRRAEEIQIREAARKMSAPLLKERGFYLKGWDDTSLYTLDGSEFC